MISGAKPSSSPTCSTAPHERPGGLPTVPAPRKPISLQRNPVEPDAIFVRDAAVWSSAGVTTGIDLALALIEQDAGRALAMNVARILVVYLKRAGGQSQYSALLAAQAESDSESFSELELWIVEHLNSDLSVDALAARVHMSPRNFARVYAAKRGRTPAKAVEAIRVDAARRQSAIVATCAASMLLAAPRF
jgi:transcriptional regulator GlxA family with amidase domain